MLAWLFCICTEEIQYAYAISSDNSIYSIESNAVRNAIDLIDLRTQERLTTKKQQQKTHKLSPVENV